ncbi:glycosyltransferase [candidate division CSSED10-310 bacterium]|uniref:Glycosyltransferase n=1 Tax=candidate division CSSED10-310 bacterium TaxID=2855610 RepID=A0ABV6YVL1_UNCC1
MKILHVIPSYEPAWAFGGTVTASSQLCRGLARQGIEVTVYTTNADGKGQYLEVQLNEPITLGGVIVWYFEGRLGHKRNFYSPLLTRKLRASIKEFDLVLVSAIWQYIQMDVSKICQSAQIPYVVTPHGSLTKWSWSRKTFKKRLYWHLISKKSLSNSAAIHFTAEDERLSTLSALPDLRKIPSFVIPNGIDIEESKKIHDQRQSFNISPDKFVLLFAGRLHPGKGIDLILKALQKMRAENIVFIILGHTEEINYVNYLRSLVDNLPSESVIWQTAVPREEMWDFYHAANLFVLPSDHENFSFGSVEAMACGLPILISRNVALWREVQSNEAGFIIHQNVDEIADIIRKSSLNKDKLSQMAQNARKLAEEHYSIDSVTRQMIQAYHDIVSGREITKCPDTNR